MKVVSLTELKNNFGTLMALVKNGKTSLLVFERDTPVIKVIFAGDSGDDTESNLAVCRLERAGLLQRAETKSHLTVDNIKKLRVVPLKKDVDIVKALLSERQEDR